MVLLTRAGAVRTAVVAAVGFVLALGGCEAPAEEEAGVGGCWVYDGSQGVLVLLSEDGEVETVVGYSDGVDYMAAEAQTATLWVADADAARLLRISNSGDKELYVSGFVRPGSVVVDPDTGDVFLCDAGALEVIALDSGGTILWRSGLAHQPRRVVVAGGEARVVLVQTLMSKDEARILGLDPADGATSFELVLRGGFYDLSADPDADHFWLATGEVLERRSAADGSLLLTVDGLGDPRLAGAMGEGCWVYDAAGRDLLLVDSDGNVSVEIEDLPGTPELSTLEDEVWLAVRDADLVALYDSTGSREVRVSTILDPSPLAGVR
jgi:DNA-binding beta-propeller fold protein YncE